MFVTSDEIQDFIMRIMIFVTFEEIQVSRFY